MKHDPIAPAEETLSVTDFKARCLDLMKRLAGGELARVTVTRRGKVVAVVTPPLTKEEAIRAVHGSMRDQTQIPDGLDLTAPVLDEPFDAEHGILHR